MQEEEAGPPLGTGCQKAYGMVRPRGRVWVGVVGVLRWILLGGFGG